MTVADASTLLLSIPLSSLSLSPVVVYLFHPPPFLLFNIPPLSSCRRSLLSKHIHPSILGVVHADCVSDQDSGMTGPSPDVAAVSRTGEIQTFSLGGKGSETGSERRPGRI